MSTNQNTIKKAKAPTGPTGSALTKPQGELPAIVPISKPAGQLPTLSPTARRRLTETGVKVIDDDQNMNAREGR